MILCISQWGDVRVVNRGGVAEVGVTPVANGHVNPVVEGRVTPTAEGPSEERRQAERPSETASGRGAGMNGSGPDADGDAGQNNQRGSEVEETTITRGGCRIKKDGDMVHHNGTSVIEDINQEVNT